MNHIVKWQGRHDGEGAAHQRFHHIVNQTPNAEFAFIGFSSDEGVKRNKGREGAAAAPDAIRKQLANLPIPQPVRIVDMGNVACVDGNLERAHTELANQVASSLNRGITPIVLGGGHEVAFGSFSGLFQYLQQHASTKRVGIINFDAHFDLRHDIQATSGTPFLQISQLLRSHQQPFHYFCIGVAKHANTKILFDTADALQCRYLYDHEVSQANLPALLAKLDEFMAQVDCLYVTVDLDVFTAATAPGVSAPAMRGIDLPIFEAMFEHIQQSGKVQLMDIAECNPKYDLDNRTARLAAYIVFKFLFNQA